ncbi:exported protein of unknown function (plasmid) [Streptomyces ambofaciens ATCC 23877]|uniref:Uncharacterized protein n=1 Tax=Streptomyces ambofaciens (strain ATCC 23877 / 3486 / DSM 40053 / JCM 4204 / NBRC 12836 / NRRL B-2516) TaxID=278992 RepID=A0A0K2B695_STRA7|nr:hypothetical protein [Streptomyces ambofaciens]AKZ60753.1 exported protein of unknown function [Streptomyces ambofaciens ATCC 23877]
MRIPPLLAQAVLVGGIALGTAFGWLTLTESRALSPGAVIVCTLISVALALVVETAVHRARRGRPRRAHARPHPTERTTP